MINGIPIIQETEISFYEFNLIHAMQTSRGIEELRDKLSAGNIAEVERNMSWIRSWKAAGFKGYNEAEQHLEEIEKYHMENFKEPYTLWWIDKTNKIPVLEWAEEFVARILKKYGVKKIKQGPPITKSRRQNYTDN